MSDYAEMMNLGELFMNRLTRDNVISLLKKREGQNKRLLQVLRAIIVMAEEYPANSIGHVVEHCIPVRDILTEAEEL